MSLITKVLAWDEDVDITVSIDEAGAHWVDDSTLFRMVESIVWHGKEETPHYLKFSHNQCLSSIYGLLSKGEFGMTDVTAYTRGMEEVRE